MTYLRFSILLLCAAVLLLQPSCKQGCTDKKALNYTKNAKDNDGSCLYCDSSLQIANFNSYSVQDENSQSQFAFQYVLSLYVQSSSEVYTGNGCQKYNLGAHAGSCYPFSFTGGLVNQINQTIVFTGQLTINYQGGQIVYNFNSVQIGPFDTLKVSNLGNICIPEDDSYFNLQLQQGYTIKYQ